jgi:predicted nucleotidyltransferase
VTSQEEALASLARLLEQHQLDYMVIGGLANAVWGEPRATLDIDVTIAAETSDTLRIVTALENEFRVLASDPVSFVGETRVLPLESRSGVRVDLIFGLLPFEREAVARARSVEVAGGEIRFCTPEDLILLKIISRREQDLTDVQGILRRRFRDLDLDYLEPRIKELSTLLTRPEIWQNWSEWKSESDEGP